MRGIKISDLWSIIHLSLAYMVFTLGEGALCPISTGSLSEGFPNAHCLDLWNWLAFKEQ